MDIDLRIVQSCGREHVIMSTTTDMKYIQLVYRANSNSTCGKLTLALSNLNIEAPSHWCMAMLKNA